MKTASCWAIIIASLVAGFGSLRADTIKLKDGTVLEGVVLEQNATEVVFEKKFAGGSITMKETIKRADIVELKLATPEEKARQVAEEAYQATLKYKLDPQRSFAKDYYEQVIEGSFRKFLINHADSPHAKEIADKINDWELERDQVAAGKIKVHGAWMDAAQAEKLITQDKAQELIKQAAALMAARRYGEAIQRWDQVLEMDVDGTAMMAERSRADCYKKYYEQLVEQQKLLTAEIPKAEQRLKEVQDLVQKAQGELSSMQGTGFKSSGTTGGTSGGTTSGGRRGPVTTGGSSGGTVKMGTDSSRFANATAQLSSARAELSQLQTRLPAMKTELAEVNRLLGVVQAKATQAGIQVASAATNAPAGTATAPPAGQSAGTSTASADNGDESGLLSQIAIFFKKYWGYALAGLVLVVWFVSRRLGQ